MRTVTVVNLSTMEEQEFNDVSPAYAVCRAYYGELDEVSFFDQQTADGIDWDKYVQHGQYSCIRGNWCALTMESPNGA